jgi:secreted trypsin-like serine protease
MRMRVFSAGAVLMIAVGFALSGTGNGPDRSAASLQAESSIVNGKPASIADWPWLASFSLAKRLAPRNRARELHACGASLLTPTLALTAGHCVESLSKKELRRFVVITGRTNLENESSGQVSAIKRRWMPLTASGKQRYRNTPEGGATWDLALLELKRPSSAGTIRIAGPDEARAWEPGRRVETAGWGLRDYRHRFGSARLLSAGQVMLDSSVCQRSILGSFDRKTMNCLGGPAGIASACLGDSGGPLTAAVGAERRLVGLTSFGDEKCRGGVRSVDTRVAGAPIRGWLHTTAFNISGIDVIGRGGPIGPKPTWCRVPRLRKVTPARARDLLRANRCRLGSISSDRRTPIARGRISKSSLPQGWLAPVGTKIGITVSR